MSKSGSTADDSAGFYVSNVLVGDQAAGLSIPSLRGASGKYRVFGHYVHLQFLVLALAEFALVFASSWAVMYSSQTGSFLGAGDSDFLFSPALRAAIISVLLVFTMAALGLYDTRQRHRFSEAASRVVASLVLAAGGSMLLFLLIPFAALADFEFVLVFFVAGLCITGARWFFYHQIDGQLMCRRVLVLGSGTKAKSFHMLRRKADQRGFKLIGFLRHPSESGKCEVEAERILPLKGRLCDTITSYQVDEIVVALDEPSQSAMEELERCGSSGVAITSLLDFFERERAMIPLDIVQRDWLIRARGFEADHLRASVKRGIDLLISLFLALIASPFMLLTAVAVYCESRGREPLLYRQQRVGLNGAMFTLFKFRSMRSDAESDGVARWAMSDDPRVTRVGAFIRKYRLDELPQLWNVLRGDMSLVGPRPERPEFVVDLEKMNSLYAERHRVRPGVTGWAQICFPYGASAKDSMSKLQYDLYYVRNHGLFLDFYTLLHTVEVILFKKGSR